MKKRVCILLFSWYLLTGTLVLVFSDNTTGFTVSGEILYKKQHDITVEVINKEEYAGNLSSVYSVIIPIGEETNEQNITSFSVTGIPEGDYIVKVYQDLNENGKFDFALVGGESLGTYKKPGFTLGRPSFKSLSFHLDKDLSGIQISL